MTKANSYKHEVDSKGRTVSRKHPKEPVIAPELIDGKWVKDCECGCGVRFEVAPRNRGQVRYTRECSDRIRKHNKYKKVSQKHKYCAVCGEHLPKTSFPNPRARKGGTSNVCYFCSPFGFAYRTKKAPECGPWDKEKGLTPTCPLYKECMARLDTGFIWLPCEAPSHFQLVSIVFAEPEEEAYYRSLVTNRFDSLGKVQPDSVDNYLAYYEDLGDKYLAKKAEEKPVREPVDLPKLYPAYADRL